jgi:hypothetical protein
MLATMSCLSAILVLALAAGATWPDVVDGAAQAALAPPAGVRLGSLAVADIREARTFARWPLSGRLEQALTDAISRRRPVFGDRGRDAVLSGTFRTVPGADGERPDYRLDLVVRDLQTKATLYALEPIVLADAALPAGSTPATGFGRLAIEVEPATALVFLDGEPLGRGSQAIPVSVGPHLVTVAADGFEVFDEPVEIKPDAPAHVVARLARPSVTVTIEASVPGAQAAIDGTPRGATPVSLSGLAAGKHRVTVTRDGYQAYEAEFEWAGGKTQVVTAALAPIPGSLVVSADVGDARVEVDGKDAGRAPVLIGDLAPGAHKVRVTAGDRRPYEQSVEVRSASSGHVRAFLGADAGAGADSRALAVVPRSASADDRALAQAVASQLQARHPDVAVADPAASLRQAQLVFPEEGADDPALVRRVAQALQARQVAVIAAGKYEPFSWLGPWPRRPTLKADVYLHQGTGPRSIAYSGIVHEGGEPWLGSRATPVRSDLLNGLAADVADSLAGRPGRPAETTDAPPLLETLSAYATDGRAGVGLGLLYEVRYFDPLEFGAGLAYSNAFGNDFKNGTRASFSGAGNDLVYGIGQNHQLRVDALWRFDGPPRPRETWFRAPRFAPYAGIGARVNVPRYEVFGVNRKDSEGGFYATEPRGSLLGGTKVQLGGLILRAELEVPVVATSQDLAIPTVTLAGGWVF